MHYTFNKDVKILTSIILAAFSRIECKRQNVVNLISFFFIRGRQFDEEHLAQVCSDPKEKIQVFGLDTYFKCPTN